jgi:23S rRNA G2069 N7-methylase RlmK/C1962 C5-methylase RlmI
MKRFSTVIKQRNDRFRRMFAAQDTSCYRVYDRDLEGYPYVIEMYGRNVLVTEYEAAAGDPPAVLEREEALEMIASMLYVPKEDIVYKFRPRLRGREQYEKLGEKGKLIPVRENGLTFLVNLTDYVDSGLFMDHRMTRAMVRAEALGKRVLNLFAYTGSFSVAAAAGGALETVTVDLSASYLDWARKNMQANGAIGDQHRFVKKDVRKYLMDAEKEKNRFDLVILDPPLFSNSSKTEGTFDLQRDYVWFIAAAMKLLAPGGRVLFGTTKKEFHFDPGRILGSESMELTGETIPSDFTHRKPHRCWLVWRKSATVARKSSSRG